jgi:hypothetical protein
MKGSLLEHNESAQECLLFSFTLPLLVKASLTQTSERSSLQEQLLDLGGCVILELLGCIQSQRIEGLPFNLEVRGITGQLSGLPAQAEQSCSRFQGIECLG